jgi:hypothetical protein
MSKLAAVVVVAGVLVSGLVSAACTGEARPVAAAARPLFLLVSLPSLGTARWFCGRRDGTYGLSFRVFPTRATTDLRLVVRGHEVERVRLDPGESHRFRLHGRSQRLELTQATGAGTLRATAAVEFERAPVVSQCVAYSPPRLTVRVGPRH